MLWSVLGSVSAIEIDVSDTPIRTAHLIVMFEGSPLLRDHVRVEIGDETLTVNAGTLNPGFVNWCEQAYVILWSRTENPLRRSVSSQEACAGGPGVRKVLDYPSSPFGIPDRFHGRDVEMPLDRWILFGVTYIDGGEEGSIIEIDNVITYYLFLTVDPPPPIGATPRPPDYTSLDEAEWVLLEHCGGD